ncbi:histidinol-phosphate transaminase, partial [Desulfovibrio sp. OttesenSCG-928-M14]|nr:histidinol-phosphate transaminase [Desulfovibrio sp. OttesenSCG-928-M14]
LPRTCPLSATEVFERLLERGLIIRPLASYGLPDCLRVSVGTPDENRFCLTCMKELLS